MVGKAKRATALTSQSLPGPAESETLCMCLHSLLENRDISLVPVRKVDLSGRSGKVFGHNTDMYADEKSDIVIVPEKLPNKVPPKSGTAEAVEERTMTKGNSVKPTATCTQRQG